MALPLRGIKVIELAGLAPVPFCGMILADFGASVIRVDRANATNPDTLARGKRSIAVNLKDPKGQAIVQKLTSNADVLIEPFRPGVMEKLNLGPDKLLQSNPRLIYARLSGYGQTGPYALRAGHDINYVAISGVLSMLGRKEQKPTPPINLLADFAGGGLTCALGIMMSLFERSTSGKGQVVDTSMTEGTAYVSSFLFKTRDLPFWGCDRGNNWLDTGSHFYDTYETQDGKYMAVGSLEPQFYQRLLDGLELTGDKSLEHFSDFAENKVIVENQFKKKTQDEWIQIFYDLDACVTPILEMDEASTFTHNNFRNSFVKNPHTDRMEPEPAPKLSRTPGRANLEKPDPSVGENSVEILKEMGYSKSEIDEFISNGTVESSPPQNYINHDHKSKL